MTASPSPRVKGSMRDAITAPVASRPTPLPLPARDRAGWRLSALTLALRACRGQSATVEQLHVLMWALQSAANADEFMRAWNRGSATPRVLRAFDVRLDDTLNLGQAAGLLEQTPSGRYKLTQTGTLFADRIRAERGLMEVEQDLFASLGSITEAGMWQRLGTRAEVSGGSGQRQ